jgi:hypothetical protein
MIQLYVGGALLAVAIAAGGWGYVERQGRILAVQKLKSARGELEAVKKSRAVAHRVSAIRKGEATKAREQARAAQKALDEALQGAAKEWGATQVPQEVLDAL